MSMGAGITQAWQGGVKLDAYNQLSAVLQTSADPRVRERLADLLGLRWVVTVPGDPVTQLAHDEPFQPRLIERPTAMPRARLVRHWTFATDVDQAMRQMRTQPPGSDTALVEVGSVGNASAGAPRSPGLSADAGGAVTSAEFGINDMTVATSAPGARLLVIGDTWYPGWTAMLDGARAPVYRVNGMFRGIFVPAGVHHVRLSYVPTHFFAWLAVSGLTALALGAAVWPIGRSRR
jgi:hypothetical protein